MVSFHKEVQKSPRYRLKGVKWAKEVQKAFWDITREQYCIGNGEYAKRISFLPVICITTPKCVFLDECNAGEASVHPVKMR